MLHEQLAATGAVGTSDPSPPALRRDTSARIRFPGTQTPTSPPTGAGAERNTCARHLCTRSRCTKKPEVGCQPESGYYRIRILSPCGHVSRDNRAGEVTRERPERARGNQEKRPEARAARAQQPRAER